MFLLYYLLRKLWRRSNFASSLEPLHQRLERVDVTAEDVAMFPSFVGKNADDLNGLSQ